MHGPPEDDSLSQEEVRYVIGLQGVVVLLTLEHGFPLIFREARGHCSAYLGKHAIKHAKKHDCCAWLQSMCGGIGIILCFEQCSLKDKCGFNVNPSICVV